MSVTGKIKWRKYCDDLYIQKKGHGRSPRNMAEKYLGSKFLPQKGVCSAHTRPMSLFAQPAVQTHEEWKAGVWLPLRFLRIRIGSD